MALFKVGDKVRWRQSNGADYVLEILDVSDDFYKSKWIAHLNVQSGNSILVHTTEIKVLEELYRLITPLEQLL